MNHACFPKEDRLPKLYLNRWTTPVSRKKIAYQNYIWFGEPHLFPERGSPTKIIFDSVNHTCFPKEDHLPKLYLIRWTTPVSQKRITYQNYIRFGEPHLFPKRGSPTKTIFDSVNHTCFPKEDRLPKLYLIRWTTPVYQKRITYQNYIWFGEPHLFPKRWSPIKTIFDSVNHTCFPKVDLPDWPCQDNQVRKGDHV